MTCLPKITPGTEGGPVVSDVYTSVADTSTIPFHDTVNSAKATAMQTEVLAIKNEGKKFERK